MPVRRYGPAPRRVVLVHGGPGAPGGMAGLARRLAEHHLGVLEPLQTADSVDGQVAELSTTIGSTERNPVLLVGSSWGALLALLTAATAGQLVARVILVGSASLDDAHAKEIVETRLARLPVHDRAEAQRILGTLGTGTVPTPAVFAQLEALFLRADHVDPSDAGTEVLEYQPERYLAVWGEAVRLRRSGELLARLGGLTCPVTVVHGDHDPHLLAGVVGPLASILDDLEVVRLPRCGHLPWLERHAADGFVRRLVATCEATLSSTATRPSGTGGVS